MPLTPPRFRAGLKAWLFTLVLLALVPVLLFAAYTAQQLAEQQRQRLVDDVRHRALDINGLIEERLQVGLGALRTLASSSDVRHDNLPGLYDQAQLLVGQDPAFRSVGLVDSSGMVLFHTRAPYGSGPFLAQAMGDCQPVFEQSQITLSGVFAALSDSTPVVALSVPVWQGSQVAYCLRLTLNAETLDELMAASELPPGWQAALVHRRTQRVVAASSQAAALRNQMVPPALQALLGQSGNALHAVHMLDGEPATMNLQAVLGGDWVLALAISDQALEAPQQRLLLQLGAAGLAWLVLSLLLSQLLATYLVGQMGAVTRAITQNNPIDAEQVHVHELRAILSHHQQMRQHDAQMQDELQSVSHENDEIRDLYDNAPCGYHSVDRQGRIVKMNRTELNWLGYRLEEVIGRPISDFYTEASQRVFQAEFPRFVEQGEVHDVELEEVCKDGSVVPVSLSATAVRDASGQFIMSRSTVFDITERKKLERQLVLLARTDPLTGLSNRRDLFDRGAREWARSLRQGSPLSVLMLDIDHFKAINDHWGHAVGDLVLQALAQSLMHQVRQMDLLGRVGGEEFVIILPDTALSLAADTAERLRQALAALAVHSGGNGDTLHFTVSIGVAERTGHDADLEALIKRADAALYRAKAEGRNRVCTAKNDTNAIP